MMKKTVQFVPIIAIAIPLHWQIPYGTAMSYTVSTGYIYTVPACPAVQFSYLYADCSCSPFFKILMPAFVSRS